MEPSEAGKRRALAEKYAEFQTGLNAQMAAVLAAKKQLEHDEQALLAAARGKGDVYSEMRAQETRRRLAERLPMSIPSPPENRILVGGLETGTV